LQADKNPQIDDAVWQAWVKKNKAQDKLRFARRLRIVGVAAVFLTLSALLWRFLEAKCGKPNSFRDLPTLAD
jgi:hypothetical protein